MIVIVKEVEPETMTVTIGVLGVVACWGLETLFEDEEPGADPPLLVGDWGDDEGGSSGCGDGAGRGLDVGRWDVGCCVEPNCGLLGLLGSNAGKKG